MKLPFDALCAECGVPFSMRRSWQRYCSTACRAAANERRGPGLRGAITSVRVMRRGKVSIVVQVGIEDRDAALKLEPGTVIEMIKPL